MFAGIRQIGKQRLTDLIKQENGGVQLHRSLKVGSVVLATMLGHVLLMHDAHGFQIQCTAAAWSGGSQGPSVWTWCNDHVGCHVENGTASCNRNP